MKKRRHVNTVAYSNNPSFREWQLVPGKRLGTKFIRIVCLSGLKARCGSKVGIPERKNKVISP